MKRQLTPSWDLVRPSVLLLREHFVAFMYLILLPSLLYVFGSLLFQGALQPDGTIQLHSRELLGVVVIVVAALWSMVNLGPVTYFLLRASAKRPDLIRTYYRQGLRYSLPLLGLYIVFGLTLIGGLILLIVPGLIVLRRYLLSPYYLVDRKLSIGDALRASAKDSKPVAGYIWGIIGVQLVCGLAASGLQIIPVIGIVIGQVVTYTITFIAVLRYKEIRKVS